MKKLLLSIVNLIMIFSMCNVPAFADTGITKIMAVKEVEVIPTPDNPTPTPTPTPTPSTPEIIIIPTETEQIIIPVNPAPVEIEVVYNDPQPEKKPVKNIIDDTDEIQVIEEEIEELEDIPKDLVIDEPVDAFQEDYLSFDEDEIIEAPTVKTYRFNAKLGLIITLILALIGLIVWFIFFLIAKKKDDEDDEAEEIDEIDSDDSEFNIEPEGES